MKKVRVGGVPEHFNYPWLIGLKDQLFRQQGIELIWINCLGGTGEMVQALKNETIDMAVVLSEGIVKAICDGCSSQVIQTYVQSPLIWGIHVAANSSFYQMSDLKSKRAAISRNGSGSHLMAYINGQQLGWNTENDLKFSIVQNLEGGVEALKNNTADYFLWEKFTTKPYVDNGTFRGLGDCPTPWPCFVIAARESFIRKEGKLAKTVLEIINNITATFKSIPNLKEIISSRYNLSLKDVEEWLKLTTWAQEMIDENNIETIQNQLLGLKLISRKLEYSSLVCKL